MERMAKAGNVTGFLEAQRYGVSVVEPLGALQTVCFSFFCVVLFFGWCVCVKGKGYRGWYVVLD